MSQLDAALATQGVLPAGRERGRGRGTPPSRLSLLVATPVDVGVLQFFPVVERVERSDGQNPGEPHP